MTHAQIIRFGLMAATALAGVPAIAQEAQPSDDAMVSSHSDRFADEIVVTARKKAETLLDVPLAIRAFETEQIQREGLRQVEDLARKIPGLTYDLGGFLNDTRPALRGMQAERGRPSVAVLIDGQDLSGENLAIAGGGASLNTALFDLERIEVVKGPQSTFYGRNAFSGAINYISKAPDPGKLSGRLGGEAGNGGLWAMEGSLNLPIVEGKAAIRLNVGVKNRDGFYRNPVTNARVGSFRSEGFGAQAFFEPVDDLTVIVRFQHSEERMNEAPTAFIGSNTRVPAPGAFFGPAPGAPATIPCPPAIGGLSPTQQAQCTRGTFIGTIAARENNLQLSPNPLTGRAFEGMQMSQDIASAEVKLDKDWGLLSYRFGWRQTTSNIVQDGDYSNFPAPPGLVLSISALQDLRNRTEQFDHEIRYRKTFGRFDLMLGAQRYTEQASLINAAQFWLRNPQSPLAGPPFNLATAPNPNFAFPVFNGRNTSYWGVYGSLGVDVTDRFKLTADVRWNRDDITYNISGWRNQDVTLSRLTPVCLPGFANGAQFSPQAPATSPPPGVVVACPRTDGLVSSKVTPRFTAEWKANDETLLYASWARGFKPGGFNTNEIVELAGQGYRPEFVDAYEVGVKSALFDRKLFVTLAGYYNDYTDQQIGVQNTNVTPGGQTITTAGIVNAGKVSIYGVEADFDLRISRELRFGMNYAWTRARFDSFVQGPPPGSAAAAFAACGVPIGQTSSDQNRAEAGNLCGDFSNNAVGRTPEHALNFNLEFRRPFRSDGSDWFLSADARYRSKRFVDESNLAVMPEFWRLGASAGIDFGSLTFVAFIDNILDNRQIESTIRNVDFGQPEGFAPGRGFIAYLPNPRNFGARVNWKF